MGGGPSTEHDVAMSGCSHRRLTARMDSRNRGCRPPGCAPSVHFEHHHVLSLLGLHLPLLCAAAPYDQSCRINATRSCFSCEASFSCSTMLKNSTVSSSVKHRPSCRYGGLSLILRSVKVLMGPSPGSPFRNRSTCRSCIC